jgi:hypothetical protein
MELEIRTSGKRSGRIKGKVALSLYTKLNNSNLVSKKQASFDNGTFTVFEPIENITLGESDVSFWLDTSDYVIVIT